MGLRTEKKGLLGRGKSPDRASLFPDDGNGKSKGRKRGVKLENRLDQQFLQVTNDREKRPAEPLDRLVLAALRTGFKQSIRKKGI